MIRALSPRYPDKEGWKRPHMSTRRCGLKWPLLIGFALLAVALFAKIHSTPLGSYPYFNDEGHVDGSEQNEDNEVEGQSTASRLKHKLHDLAELLPFKHKHEELGERLAYVTFLSESDRHEAAHKIAEEAAGVEEALSEPDVELDLEADLHEEIDEHKDRYFIAARMLGYQLMHDPATRTRRRIPYIVLVTDDVTPYKRSRLERDGAIVIPVEDVAPLEWAEVGFAPWREVFTKLRAWELMDMYDRALFIDVDHMLTRPLDGVFDEPGAQAVPSLGEDLAALHPDEAPLPERYVFASMPEALPDHHFPPTLETNDFKGENYFNAGFFIFAPDQRMFEYYLSVMGIKDRFDPTYPEQGLLNYAHRRKGGVPWTSLGVEWDVHFPNMNDREGGVASVHDKWWGPERDQELKDWYTSIRWRMEGFYEAWDRRDELLRA